MFEVKKDAMYATNYSEGVSVMRISRYYWLYEAEPRLLILGANSGFDASNQHVSEVQFPKNLSWQRPYEGEAISEEKKAVIKSHLREALAVLSPNSLVEFYDE